MKQISSSRPNEPKYAEFTHRLEAAAAAATTMTTDKNNSFKQLYVK